MIKKSTLSDFENRLSNQIGGSIGGKGAFFLDKDLHCELSDLSWFELHLYAITGRFFDENSIKLLNYIWVSTSYPDQRIWNNRIVSLGGSFGANGSLALSAGMAVSDAEIYGHGTSIKAIEFLIRVQRQLNSGQDMETLINRELASKGKILGYGRPVSRTDERVPHLLAFMKKHHIKPGKHFNLAFQIGDFLKKEKNILINICAPNAAIAADLSFTPQQYYLFMNLCFYAGMVPCFIQNTKNKEGSFLPLRQDCIVYSGPNDQNWQKD